MFTKSFKKDLLKNIFLKIFLSFYIAILRLLRLIMLKAFNILK